MTTFEASKQDFWTYFMSWNTNWKLKSFISISLRFSNSSILGENPANRPSLIMVQ